MTRTISARLALVLSSLVALAPARPVEAEGFSEDLTVHGSRAWLVYRQFRVTDVATASPVLEPDPAHLVVRDKSLPAEARELDRQVLGIVSRPVHLPAAVSVVVDTSGSMAGLVDLLRAFVADFLFRLDDDDLLQLVTFDTTWQATDFATAERWRWRFAMRELETLYFHDASEAEKEDYARLNEASRIATWRAALPRCVPEELARPALEAFLTGLIEAGGATDPSRAMRHAMDELVAIPDVNRAVVMLTDQGYPTGADTGGRRGEWLFVQRFNLVPVVRRPSVEEDGSVTLPLRAGDMAEQADLIERSLRSVHEIRFLSDTPELARRSLRLSYEPPGRPHRVAHPMRNLPPKEDLRELLFDLTTSDADKPLRNRLLRDLARHGDPIVSQLRQRIREHRRSSPERHDVATD